MRPESIPIAQRLSPSRVRSTKGAFSPQGSGGGGADGTFLGMKLAADQVRYVAQLARLGLSDAEMEAYSDELSKILDYVGQLSQLNTDAIPPTAQVGDLHDVMRDDLVGPSLGAEVAVAGAPDRDDGYFRVKAMQDEMA